MAPQPCKNLARDRMNKMMHVEALLPLQVVHQMPPHLFRLSQAPGGWYQVAGTRNDLRCSLGM